MPIEDDIDIKVIVEGREANEYPADPQVDEKTGKEVVTKYVEVTSGAQFAFRATISPSYQYGREDALSMRVSIDGNFCEGVVWYREMHSHITGSVIVVDCTYQEIGTSTQKVKFHFADLEIRDTVDAAELQSVPMNYGSLGTLQVTFNRVMVAGLLALANKFATGVGAVPEKALKGRALNVAAQFKAEPCGRVPNSLHCRTLDKQPVLTKRYLYRTKASLQSEMIIPRSPSPPPIDEAEEDLTPEQMREVIRKQREQLAIKHENTPPNLKRERSISTSLPPRPLKSSRNEEGNIVYHLDSDDDETPPQSTKKTAEPVEVINLT